MLKSSFHFNSFGISDVGLVREHNEDVWASYPEEGLFLLADGMGGHAAGEVAAQETVSQLYEHVKNWFPIKQTPCDEAISFFRESLMQVNTAIYHKGQSESSLSGMGTTVCALYFFHEYAILAHVGDSRIYLFREGKLEQVTEDHSLVAELISIGAIKPHEADSVPYKHILTRAIGTNPSVDPTVSYLETRPNDSFLLCSDGLTNYVSDEEIEMILNKNLPLNESAQKLIELANTNGGGDNITLVLVEVSNDLS